MSGIPASIGSSESLPERAHDSKLMPPFKSVRSKRSGATNGQGGSGVASFECDAISQEIYGEKGGDELSAMRLLDLGVKPTLASLESAIEMGCGRYRVLHWCCCCCQACRIIPYGYLTT